jgi:hypothetical protein
VVSRDPIALFNVSQYLKENPYVAKARINPLVHFIMHERRGPTCSETRATT